MTNPNPHIAQELLSHQAFLRRLAIDLVGEDADDLVQDVWKRALERPPHHGYQLRGWLTRVARNLVADRWRGETRRTDREKRRACEQPAADELDARFELRKELVRALDSLNQPCRETILLRYFEGLGPLDIADRQGIPVATVKTRLRRGLALLRETLDKQYGGDRATWMSAVTALGVPVGSGGMTGTFVTGAIAMGTMMKVTAAVLLAAACVYFATRTTAVDSPQMAAVEPPATNAELVGVETLSATELATEVPTAEGMGRSPVAEKPPVGAIVSGGINVLRIVLEGINEADAQMATVLLTGVNERNDWLPEIRDSWQCKGLTNEFDIDPFLASAHRHEDLRATELEVEVRHPHYLSQRTLVALSRGVKSAHGKIVHEARIRLVRPGFWPKFKLSVRDANTRAHLEDVELRFTYGVGSAAWGRNEVSSLLDDGLRSPIELMGGHEPNMPEFTVAGLALMPATGELPRLVELGEVSGNPKIVRRFAPELGIIVFAQAPGYAPGSITVDVSENDERELLLEPSAELSVRLANMQLEQYAALETTATLCVYWVREDGGNQYVRFEPLNEMLETEGLRLDSLAPGEYRVAVELGGGGWAKRPVLASGEITLAAGDWRELVLTLENPPASPEHATLGGVVSFPVFGGEEEARLQFYEVAKHDSVGTQARYQPIADIDLSLTDLERVGGTLPTWSFRVEDLPVGLYQIQLWPLLKSWMIEVPAGGVEGVRLVIPELAEVLLETVDARTGERIPIDQIYYRNEEVLPQRVQMGRAKADLEEPGLFRFWAVPGEAITYPYLIASPLDYGKRSKHLRLAPGFQSVRFQLEPVYAFRIEFRDGGVALDRFDELSGSSYSAIQESIRAVNHKGRLTDLKLSGNALIAEVSAPGIYEFSLEGVGTDRFLPIPPQLVAVRAGEKDEVIVELYRK